MGSRGDGGGDLSGKEEREMDIKEKAINPSRRTQECSECHKRTFDTGKRPLVCAHCGATIIEKV